MLTMRTARTQSSSSNSATMNDPPTWLMNSTLPQLYQKAGQGAFEASLGGMEDNINSPMELDWLSPLTGSKGKENLTFLFIQC